MKKPRKSWVYTITNGQVNGIILLMKNLFYENDPSDYPGPILESGGPCNLNVSRILELKRKYGLSRRDDPFKELVRRGATSEEISSMTTS